MNLRNQLLFVALNAVVLLTNVKFTEFTVTPSSCFKRFFIISPRFDEDIFTFLVCLRVCASKLFVFRISRNVCKSRQKILYFSKNILTKNSFVWMNSSLNEMNCKHTNISVFKNPDFKLFSVITFVGFCYFSALLCESRHPKNRALCLFLACNIYAHNCQPMTM
ncbi:hypothetical protein EGR_10161 [Echinococcus granulosus]|uniref:Uncharacterized protein n=1 Tax=Echinococcus granulosus TaxID=6210 RepID=W6U917_ECHGR|nr:hypothetical protein EGR_10161 [Echinococcus granulosus]EUB54977.1 hypothetical protein EGR_10161 [Echinococcus granulosus]